MPAEGLEPAGPVLLLAVSTAGKAAAIFESLLADPLVFFFVFPMSFFDRISKGSLLLPVYPRL